MLKASVRAPVYKSIQERPHSHTAVSSLSLLVEGGYINHREHIHVGCTPKPSHMVYTEGQPCEPYSVSSLLNCR